MTFNGPGTNGGDFEMGVTEISYTAVDGSGNEAVCSFTIVVSGLITIHTKERTNCSVATFTKHLLRILRL